MTMVLGEDARRDFMALRKRLPESQMTLLENVIVGRMPARRIAADRCGKDNVTGRVVSEVAQEVKEALEAASAHFGFRSRWQVCEV